MLNEVLPLREQGERKVLASRFIPKLLSSTIGAAILSVWIESAFRTDSSSALERLMQYLGILAAELKESREIALVARYDDYQRNMLEGRFPLFLSVEGLDGIGTNVDLLYMLHHYGVRMASLTWNDDNTLASGCGSDKDYGVTTLGKKALKIMEELGIVVDAAHASPKSFWDIVEGFERTVLISHGNVYALCRHRRNFTDDQLKAVAERNGLIGLSTVKKFLKENGEASAEDLIRHISYAADLVGIEYVALGLDIDYRENSRGTLPLEEVSSLERGLLEAGYSKAEAEAVLHGNWERLLKGALS
nr:membrane dipeptidase [Acetomicrobium sp. S15 = DSM 107314]